MTDARTREGGGRPCRGRGRGGDIGFAIDAIVWACEKRAGWTRYEFAEAMGIGDRAALRWIKALEARDLVEHGGTRTSDGRGSQPLRLWRRTARAIRLVLTAEGAA